MSNGKRYDFSAGTLPAIRLGVHNEENRKKDLSGKNALLSTHFYYFGETPIEIPENLKCLIKKNQGHKKTTRPEVVKKFEAWIGKKPLKICNDPQLKKLLTKGDCYRCIVDKSEQ